MRDRRYCFKHARRLSFQTLESRLFLDASSQPLLNTDYRAEVNESTLTDQGIFFVRDDVRFGTELWKSDAAGSNPHLVIDLTPGAAGSQLTSLTTVDGGVYFLEGPTGSLQNLWWTDGSAENTRMVADNVAPITRTYVDEQLVKPLPNDGTHVFFVKWSSGTNETYRDTGIWAASNQGRTVQQVTDRSSFVDSVTGTWAPSRIESFQETKSGLAVFIVWATVVNGEQSGDTRRFFGVTDGTLAGTRISNAEVRETSYLMNAVSLSEDKAMFVARSNEATGVYTIDKDAHVELLTESIVSPKIEFQKTGTHWYFSAPHNDQLALFRTDGTVAGTQVIESAGPVHSSPVVLSNGNVLTLAGVNFFDRDFQVTDPETLLTTKLDFILPSGSGMIRELYGSITVGNDKFFYVESKGGNARRLMMADLRERTVSTVLDGEFNAAIGASILRGDKIYFNYVTPTHSDLIRFNTLSKVSTTLASVQTEAWQGLTIDWVDEDRLVGFLNNADNASIFQLRFSDDKLDVVSLVDEFVLPMDRYSEFIPRRTSLPMWKIDNQTVAFPIGLEINGQRSLEQVFAFDTSANGLTKLIPSTAAQPSPTWSFHDNQTLYRAGGKLVYHSGDQLDRPDGSRWHEIWAAEAGKPGQKLIDSKSIEGSYSLYPLAVLNDRFYFLSISSSKAVLYRTNEDATAVELVTETQWLSSWLSLQNFEILYRPVTSSDPQRILIRTSGDSMSPGIWEITGALGTLNKVLELPAINGNDDSVVPGTVEGRLNVSAGLLSYSGAPLPNPIVEVLASVPGSSRMVPFFGESASLSDEQKSVTRLFRLQDAWVGIVAGPDDTYSFWSRPDDSSEATRVSEIDLKPFKIDNLSIGLRALAATPDAVVLVAGAKLIG